MEGRYEAASVLGVVIVAIAIVAAVLVRAIAFRAGPAHD
jgi:hypothetical protein